MTYVGATGGATFTTPPPKTVEANTTGIYVIDSGSGDVNSNASYSFVDSKAGGNFTYFVSVAQQGPDGQWEAGSEDEDEDTDIVQFPFFPANCVVSWY